MKKTIILPILIISLLLLVSCNKEEQPTTKGAFIGGTQGVLATFEPFGIEEEGVYNLFDEETFPLEVTVRNKGEHDIQPGDVIVKLLGPTQSEFEGISSWEILNGAIIEKISELVPTGGEETFSFASDAKYLGGVTGVLEREWFANIEYNYKTSLIVPEVCLKEDLNDNRVCDAAGKKDFFVSGAPIIVKSVEESTAGKGIVALKIVVSNAGSGRVTQLRTDFGVRNSLSVTIDDEAWECKSAGKIGEARLVEGQAEIICKLKKPLAKGHLSTKQVQLSLDYKYRDLIQEKLRIKQSAK